MDKFEEIKNFKELLDNGIITQEEFDKKKKELLEGKDSSSGTNLINGIIGGAKEKSEQAKAVAAEKLEELKKKQAEDAEKRKKEEEEKKQKEAELQAQKTEGPLCRTPRSGADLNEMQQAWITMGEMK